MNLLNKQQMQETIYRKNIQVEFPFKKTTLKVIRGMVWWTKFDPNGNPFAYYGKKIKGGNK